MNKFKLVLISFALLISANTFAYTCSELTTSSAAVKNSLANVCNFLQSAIEQKKKTLIENFTRIPPPESRGFSAPERAASQVGPAATTPSNTASPAKLVR